jgi:uncharacterized protein (TIGR00369 family)
MEGAAMPVVMTIPELEGFLAAEFPQAFFPDSGLSIEALWDGGCRVRQAFREVSLRPGGTISGPTMMALADIAMYVALLAAIGPVPLAVTINLNINFLRKPGRCDLTAEARLLKLGKRLASGEVTLCCEGEEAPVAHANTTYSIPPARR